MVFTTNNEIEAFFRLHDPIRQQDYQEGFDDGVKQALDILNEAKKKIEKLEAFTEISATVSAKKED